VPEKTLVIVESPTKAKTITKFLGPNYVVKASNGHVRDLPNNAAEIPAAVKKEPWARLGIQVDKDFEALYVVPQKKKEHVKTLKEALKGASQLFLATDEDREGESISWHLVEVLKPKIPTKRMVFHEITKEAIAKAIESPRDIDENLVRAQETRRLVDRLFGYEVSPLLWKKMAPGLSAGRVQSVAVRLLVERERARIRFKSAEYWGMKGLFGDAPESVEAELFAVGERRLAIGKDFDQETGKLQAREDVVHLLADEAKRLEVAACSGKAQVLSVEERPFTQKPSAPFVTSTLQQEGNRKLRYSAKRTMQIAQQLYENGFITYMRTDSTTLSEQALDAARSLIKRDFGNDFLHQTPRVYATKVKNAQEAHEAIRPAGDKFTPPEVVRAQLGEEAFKLYDLIWKRTVASQMADARGTYVNVVIGVGEAKFKAVGKTIAFAGFLRAYVEGSDDPEADLSDQEKILPPLKVGQNLSINKVEAVKHDTQPPARFTEGSLIKELEKLGIGRPSTWATIVELVLSREYAFKKGTALVPTFTAMAVLNLLEKSFKNVVDYDFTARLEDDLDSISRGEASQLEYLKRFYIGNGHPGLKALVEEGEKQIDPREVCGLPLGHGPDGKFYEIRIGRFGPFLSDGERRTSVPDGMCPDELTLSAAMDLLERNTKAAESLGGHPETGQPIYLKAGPYGPYVQLGDQIEGEKKKPKMSSLLPGMSPETLTFEEAVKLLSLPRNLGKYQESDIIVSNGRFGPYIKCGKETRSIPLAEMSPLDMTFEQAVALLSQPKGRGRTQTPKSLRELGNHPQSGKALSIKSGRYGPYVTDGEINASLPRGRQVESLSVEEAVQLLSDRAQKIAEEGAKSAKRGKKKAATPKNKKSGGKDEATISQ
jgi:DNA topoisomerase-1